MTNASVFDDGPDDMTALLEDMDAGRTTPAEAVEQAIRRAMAANPSLNCIAWPTFGRACDRARLPRQGALAGIPTMIKDHLAEKGLPMSWGSAALREWIPTEDDPYTSAIEAAGLISIARSTMPELGMNTATESPLTGPTRNPWNLDYAPGGSSGGGSAAVAAGIVPISHASDGLGSIRHGAGPCGLVGLKPSRGRNSGDEARVAATDFSVSGCVSRTVRDTAAWLYATQTNATDARFAPVPPVTRPVEGALRIRAHDKVMRTGAAPDASVGRIFEETITLLEGLGHSVGKAVLPFDGPSAMSALAAYAEGGFARHVQTLSEQLGEVFQSGLLEHRSATLVSAGSRIDDDRMATALQRLQDSAAAYIDGFGEFDIWMTPTFSREVIRVGEFSPDLSWDEHKDDLFDYAGYCWIDNVAGTPAISLPMGFSANGLPVGIQFATRPGGEALLLGLALQLENVVEWWRNTPPVWVGNL